MSVAVIGQTTRDTVTDRTGRKITTTGGAPIFAGRALRAAGVEPVLVSKGLPLDGAVELPSRSVVDSVLAHGDAGTVQRLDAVGDPFTVDEALHVILPAVRSCTWLVLGGQSAGDFPPETIAALGSAGHPLALDGQGLARGADPGPVELRGFAAEAVRGVHALKMNVGEVEAFGGERAVRALGVPELIVSDGRRGAWVLAGGGVHRVAASDAEFSDPTGAGDALLALYALERSRGVEPGEALERAVAWVERAYAPTPPRDAAADPA